MAVPHLTVDGSTSDRRRYPHLTVDVSGSNIGPSTPDASILSISGAQVCHLVLHTLEKTPGETVRVVDEVAPHLMIDAPRHLTAKPERDPALGAGEAL